MADTANLKISNMAPKGPFRFGLGIKGELIIQWDADFPVGDLAVPMGLLMSVEHSRELFAFLEEHKSTQEMLAAAPPTQSKH
jgi:hypothetical protein